ncbi:MAG: 2Fe-2S iron-sulfur cluster-binding protein [Anaerolineae bacterium]|jgi:ferredoxin|nr:2Fe-2S iron-sulfur cluster-binding protein [Anaerolineae bacterium]
MDIYHDLTVIVDEKTTVLQVLEGSNLRRVLLDHGFSPYAAFTTRLNCGGRGLCATCGVWIEQGTPAPEHWHDQIGAYFGYPRLSCQIVVNGPMTVRLLTDKRIWGGPQRDRRWRS